MLKEAIQFPTLDQANTALQLLLLLKISSLALKHVRPNRSPQSILGLLNEHKASQIHNESERTAALFLLQTFPQWRVFYEPDKITLDCNVHKLGKCKTVPDFRIHPSTRSIRNWLLPERFYLETTTVENPEEFPKKQAQQAVMDNANLPYIQIPVTRFSEANAYNSPEAIAHFLFSQLMLK